MGSMTASASPRASANGRTLVLRSFGEVPFHTDGVPLTLAFGPDGSLWSIEEPGILRHWNADTGRQIEWHALSEMETLWAFSADAQLLVSASDDLSIWDVATGRLRGTLSMKSWVTAVAFSHDQGLLATGHDDGRVHIWDLAHRKALGAVGPHPTAVSALAFSADGSQLASAGEERLIHVWDVKSGKKLGTLEGHTDRIPALAWHPSGKLLISAGWDTTARVWDTTTFEPIILLNSHASQVVTLALSQHGGLLACADSANAVHIWDVTANRTLAVLKGYAAEIKCLAFSPDGERVAAGGENHLIVVKRWQNELLSSKLISPTSAAPATQVLTRIAVNADGSRLATASGEKALRIWDTRSAQLVTQPVGAGGLHSVAYSADGTRLAGGSDGKVRIWESASGRLQSTLEGPRTPITCVAFAPQTNLLAGASTADGVVWLWDLKTGQPCLLVPEAADGCTIEAIAFHPNGRLLAVCGVDWLATSGSDGAVAVWDVVERAEVALFGNGASSLAFDPSGKRIAVASLARSLCVYDLETKDLVAELTGHEDAVNCVAYSPDGKMLASGSDDHTLRLWAVARGTCLACAELDTQIKSIAFSADGKYLFTGNGNTSAYQLEVQKLLK
jgi:WD40 repeat protein